MRMISNRWLPGLLFILVLSTPLHSQKLDYYESHWNTGFSPKDGENFFNKMQYEEKSKFLFYIANDTQDISIYLMVTDRAAIQKIMRYGMTTWFSPDVKHRKSLGIEFPVPGGENPGPSQGEARTGSPQRKEMMTSMMAEKNRELVLIGFSGKGIRDTVSLIPGSDMKGSLEMPDRDKILISLTIPVARIKSAGEGKPDQVLSIGFETGYLDLNRQGIGQAGGGQTYEGGGHGGGMYGGPPPGGGAGAPMTGGTDRSAGKHGQGDQPDIADLARPTRLWISEVRLAWP